MISLGTAVAAFMGTIKVRDNIDFRPNGTTTGATVQINGVTAWQQIPFTCTSTGGLTKYPTCYIPSPYTTTGAVIDIALDCGNTLVNMVMSGSFVKSRSATTFGRNLIRNSTVGSGGLLSRSSQTGSQVPWNPVDGIRLTTITAAPNTAVNCSGIVTARDKAGS